MFLAAFGGTPQTSIASTKKSAKSLLPVSSSSPLENIHRIATGTPSLSFAQKFIEVLGILTGFISVMLNVSSPYFFRNISQMASNASLFCASFATYTPRGNSRSEEHTSELQSRQYLV